jgi:hypothetical protein
LLLAGQTSSAASLTATALDEMLAPGGTTTVSVSLELGEGEVASVFEGTIQLMGSTLDVTSTITAPVSIGLSWPGALQNVQDDQVSLSLTSSNAGGNRLLASFEITVGQEAGTLTVLMLDGAFAQRDLDQPPFTMDVPIDNVGLPLAQISIPEPSTALLHMTALLTLMGVRRFRVLRK